MQRRDLVFRVFVSSTFGDLVAERNALQARVFPKLRDYCLQCGARFQAIDLRWGVSEEAALDQQTMKICFQELSRCQMTSPRPNFIVLLGDRYGWRPLPPRIPAEEFNLLLGQVDPAKLELLKWEEAQPEHQQGWYRLDDNAVPGEYVLQPRRVALKNDWTDGQKQAARDAEAARWHQQIEPELHRLMCDAARKVWPNQQDPRRDKYENSATHQEIQAGALRAEDAPSHVFCYFRQIGGLPEGVEAVGFRDLLGDREARTRLESLKAELKAFLPAEHVYEYQATWADGRPQANLDALCGRVEQDLRGIIDQELAAFKHISEVDREIEAHREFGKDRARHFLGRQDVLHKIQEHLARDGMRLMVVHGPSGSGKSAVIAKAILDLESRLAHGVVVGRFIGATPGSSDLRSLLESVCRQIGQAYGNTEAAPEPGNVRELVQNFSNRLALATADRPLVVFLDALDQLSPVDRARNLGWLPRELPPHAQLVASVLESNGPQGDCFRAAKGRAPVESFVPVAGLSTSHGQELLDVWLAAVGRSLQPAQRDEVLGKFAQNGLPLYLRLAFEEARQWKSYEDSAVPRLSPDIPGILKEFLIRLEAEPRHGRVITRRALGYLAAGRNGLTEDELLDVLSRDQDVMSEFRRRSPKSPAVNSLPPVVWSRLYVDLEAYLTTRRADGTTVLTFYHRQVGEAIVNRYLSHTTAQAYHRELAAYFRDKADSQQDSSWTGADPRAFSHLIHHQMHGRLTKDLGATVTDPVYLAHRLAILGGRTIENGQVVYDEVFALQADLAAAAAAGLPAPVREVLSAVTTGLRATLHLLMVMPHLIGPVVHNALIGAGRGAECRKAAEKMAARVPRPWLRLAALAGHSSAIERSLSVGPYLRHAQISLDGRRAVVATDSSLSVWDLDSGKEIDEFDVDGNEVLAAAINADGTVIAGGSAGGMLCVWDVGSHVPVLQQQIAEKILSLGLSPNGQWLAVGGVAHDGCLLILHLASRESWPLACRDPVRALAVSPDNRYVVAGDQAGRCHIVDLRLMERLNLLHVHGWSVRGLDFDLDGRRIASAAQDGSFSVWWVTSRLGWLERLRAALQGRLTFPSPDAPPQAIAFLPGGRSLITGDQQGRLVVRDANSGREQKQILGHAGRLRSLSAARDRPRLLSAARGDPLCHVWDTTALEASRSMGRIVRLLAADRETGILAAHEMFDVTLYRGDGSRQFEIPNTHGVIAMVADPSGQRFAFLNKQARLGFWTMPSPGCRPRSPRWVASGLASVRHPRLAFSDDGSQLAVSGETRIAFFCWEGRRADYVHDFLFADRITWGVRWDCDRFHAFHASQNRFITWDFADRREPDCIIRSVKVGDHPYRDLLVGPKEKMVHINYVSPFGPWAIEEEMRKRLGAVGHSEIRIADLAAQEAEVIARTERGVWVADLSATGKYLALTCEGDDRVRLYSTDIQSSGAQQEIASYPFDLQVNALAFDRTQEMLVAGDVQGNVHLLHLRIQ